MDPLVEAFTENVKIEFKLKHLAIHLGESYSSRSPNYRQNVRENIGIRYGHHMDDLELDRIKNLSMRPESAHVKISISHCKKTGGYAASDVDLGFDIELKERISNDVIRRVCSPKEIELAAAGPATMNYLWPAKEALFKASARFGLDSLVMAHFEIREWRTSVTHAEVCHFSAVLNDRTQLHGAVLETPELLLALAF